MDFQILEFIVVLAFVERIWSLPLSCLYNGMSHKEGETVRTDEPCLSCICQSGVLECNLKVCTEYPNVLPPGCFLLQKPSHCCLQVFCDENFSSIGIELLTSYKSKNKLHENDCTINGSVYGDGSAVASSQPCEYCYCVEGEIKCIKPRCPYPFEGCKPVYETSSCCPVHYDCISADINVTVSSDSLRSEKGDLNVTENAETDISNTEEELPEESTTTITAKGNAEETTFIPIQKSTVPVVEDYMTTPGFQIMEPESFSKELEIVTLVEDGNVSSSVKEVPELQMRSTIGNFKRIESSVGSNDGSGGNASQEIVDYDSYDYSESQLPPSLPNLVIFPFVAADAIIKSTGERDLYDRDQIEKADTHHIFYKDYFTPPLKSEGGFVPKKPSKSEEPFYEHVYLSREHIESPNEDMRENTVAALQTNVFPQGPKEMNSSASADNKGTSAASADRPDSDLNGTVDPLFEEVIQPESETAPGFLLRDDDETTFHENNQTKKPVTVTFKNFVVDFYPKYLITTSKRKLSESGPQTAAGETFRLITRKPEDAVALTDATSDSLFSFYNETNTSAPSEARQKNPVIIPINSPGKEPFSFNKFMHLFSSEATSTTMTTIATTSKKHKFSSKIKNQLITTVKPKREKISQKVGLEVDIVNLSTEPYSVLSGGFAASFSVADKSYNYNVKLKPKETENVTRFNETVKPEEMKNKKVELTESLSGGNTSSVNRKPGIASTVDGNNCVTPNAGALLKLAGCNIYGMMYRVGKVIMELSGPCLECLCTDLGVQCKPLKC